MATPSGSGKNRGPIVDPGLCRCCRSIKKCRLLTAEYLWNGEKEIYSDMFMDCFGLLLSHLDGDSKECCICAACVSRLRDACAFRRQALQSEEVFLSARLETKQGLDSKILLEVKQEPPADDNDSMGADDVGMGEPDLEEQDPKSEPSPSDASDADYKPRRNKKPGRRQLLAKMNKLRDKLDHMMSATGKKN
ncbi:uncharacterized protein LOC135085905 [Ostrinia nubilalis]|uniref:uncharacterized protein LOC135085905 n=1 Tax=Ostrinia nubilalis TaxID=29057 RepID=UPI0030823986